MTRVNFKNNELNVKIKPSLSNTIQNLESAKNITNSMPIPSNFSQAATVRNIDDFIAEIKKDLNEVISLIETSNKSFDEAMLESTDKLKQIEDLKIEERIKLVN